MPRKVPWETKEKWLDAVENGKTIAKLANDSKRDKRTVQKAVEEVRQHRHAAAAQLDLLKAGLRRHQDDLLGLVQETASAATSLPLHVDLHYPSVSPPRVLELTGARAFYSGGEYAEVRLLTEEQFHWPLLREHLGNDPAYRHLGHWKTAILEELNARLALGAQVVEVIHIEAKLDLGEDPRSEGGVTPRGLDQVVRAVVSRSVGEEPPYPLDVSRTEEGGLVINQIEAGHLREVDLDVAGFLLSLPKEIADREPGRRLRVAREKVDEQVRRASQAFLEIRASHYLPGNCRSCKRLGR